MCNQHQISNKVSELCEYYSLSKLKHQDMTEEQKVFVTEAESC